MKKNLAIFLLFSKYSIKTAFQSPIGVGLFTAGKLVRFAMFFLFVYYLIFKTKLLAGYDVNQTVIFYLTYNIIDTFSQLFFREVYRFRPLIISAEFDTILVKPYHPFLRILVGGLDPMDAFIGLIYVAMLIFFILQAGPITLLGIVGFIALVINAFIIALAFHIAVLALGILSTEVDHTIMIYRDMTKMASFPIDIYQEPIRSIFTFIIPIGVMMTFPVKSLFGLLDMKLTMISFAIALISLIVSLILWNRALRKYQSWGG